MKDKAK